ncbi:MAG: PAS domain-containing protein, partial [Pseudomonadota bacterium]
MQDIDSASDQRREGPPASQRSTRRSAARTDDVTALRLPPMRMEDSCCVVMWEAEPTRAYHTWVNTPAEQLLGFPMNHWHTEQNFWAQRLHPEDRVRVSHAFHQAIRDQGTCEHTYRMLHADGSVRWIQEQVKVVDLPIGEGGPTPRRLRGTMIDVTEYRREIDALERSRAFYRSLFDDAPALYFVLDDEGMVKQVNQRGASELGYERSSLLDTCFSRLQTGTEAIDITHLLEVDDGPQEWHTALRRANGSPLPVRLRALKGELLDEEGDPLDAGSLLVACDPTSQPTLREAPS